uniref:uncharacterized protein LOC109960605 n=1 Tax=Monopterus albus TaxID=43700 RepID=UPI0009B49483|nr:uncharacterized protein LOC109960605 [Monopterus albus]
MWTLFVLCSVIATHGVRGADNKTTEAMTPTASRDSCRYNCGKQVGQCSCSSSCGSRGNCCPDYEAYCSAPTPRNKDPQTKAQPSCRYNCGRNMGSCSCSSSCEYYGNCCYDYYSYCYYTTYPTAPAQALVNTMATVAMTTTLIANGTLSHPPQTGPHADTTVARTWEAVPAQALVNTMGTAVMTITPTAQPQPTSQPQQGPVEARWSALATLPAQTTLDTTTTMPTVCGTSKLQQTRESPWYSHTCSECRADCFLEIIIWAALLQMEEYDDKNKSGS